MLSGLLFLAAGSVIPEQWWDRMGTIQTYESDGSAMSRLHSWRVAWQLALDLPLTGGGFWALEDPATYRMYGTEGSHSAHSIYFSILSEHGFPGLFLFLGLLISCLWSLFRVRRILRGVPSGVEIIRFSLMVEASIVAYMISGTFLTMAYFDLFYHLVSFVIVLKILARQEVTTKGRSALDGFQGAVGPLPARV
jgi:probable O-glycosylation ligase (exosortase A-associated)